MTQEMEGEHLSHYCSHPIATPIYAYVVARISVHRKYAHADTPVSGVEWEHPCTLTMYIYYRAELHQLKLAPHMQHSGLSSKALPHLPHPSLPHPTHVVCNPFEERNFSK